MAVRQIVVLMVVVFLGACSAEPETGGLDQGTYRPDASPVRSDVERSADVSVSDAARPIPAVLCDPPLSGNKKVTLIRVSWSAESYQGGAADPLCDAASLRRTWFAAQESVAAFWSNASAGRVEVKGETIRSVVVDKPSWCLSRDEPGQVTRRLLKREFYPDVDAAAGVTPQVGETVVYVLPESFNCDTGAGGYQQSPKGLTLPSRVVEIGRIFLFNNACELVKVAAHELGHEFGMQHASTPDDSKGYGDASDVMGKGMLPPNAPHRAQLGWIPPEKVIEAPEPGTFDLAPLGDDANTAAQLIVVPTGDPARALFVSYRRDAGIDAGLGAEYHERLSVHGFAQRCPGSDRAPPTTLLLKTLGPGETYQVAGGATRVQLVAAGVDRAEVLISQ
jgi:M6 family metalloprotease-like protein